MTQTEQQNRRRIGRLHVLTDLAGQDRYSHAELARLCIEGGADTIQFRQKTGTVRQMLKEAELVGELCRKAGVQFLVNDRVDVALAVRADGVHLGLEDLPIRAARRIMGPGAVLGATASLLQEALRAQDDGADYIGFGPVFPTRSKADPAPVRGLEALQQVAEALEIPVIGIAGVTAERIPSMLRAGVHGVAVMSAITHADRPGDATGRLRLALETMLKGNF